MERRLLRADPPKEVLASQGPVDAEGGSRALGCSDDAELHVADDITGNKDTRYAGGLMSGA